MEDNNNIEGTMLLTRSLLPLLFALAVALPAHADDCADLSSRFAGAERFHMTLGELDELKSCINVILREKISATSAEARGATSPSGAVPSTTATMRPRAVPTLQDAE
jgi:hypothetical protein